MVYTKIFRRLEINVTLLQCNFTYSDVYIVPGHRHFISVYVDICYGIVCRIVNDGCK